MGESKLEARVLPRLSEIREWTKQGASEKSIAEALGVGVSTFRAYKKKSTALSAALAEGQVAPKQAVETSFFKRATGYDYEEVTETYRLTEGEMKLFERRVYHRHMPGDVRAQMFWLANKAPEEWAFHPEHAGEDGGAACGVVILPAAADGEEEPGDEAAT